jgi:hypothetical protein
MIRIDVYDVCCSIHEILDLEYLHPGQLLTIGQPYFVEPVWNEEYRIYWYLKDYLHEWFQENKIDYELYAEFDSQVWIEFPDQETATLFMLRWKGNI